MGLHTGDACSIPNDDLLFAAPAVGTPRQGDKEGLRSPPSGPRIVRSCPLFKALKRNEIEELRCVLRDNAEAINDYFFDNDFEPTLCAAVRLKCSADIIRLLMDHSADAAAKNKYGLRAIDVLGQSCPASAPAFSDLPMYQLPLFPSPQASWSAWPYGGATEHLMPELEQIFSSSSAELDAVVNQRETWYREVAALLKV
jgi:hypothetical protein